MSIFSLSKKDEGVNLGMSSYPKRFIFFFLFRMIKLIKWLTSSLHTLGRDTEKIYSLVRTTEKLFVCLFVFGNTSICVFAPQ